MPCVACIRGLIVHIYFPHILQGSSFIPGSHMIATVLSKQYNGYGQNASYKFIENCYHDLIMKKRKEKNLSEFIYWMGHIVAWLRMSNSLCTVSTILMEWPDKADRESIWLFLDDSGEMHRINKVMYDEIIWKIVVLKFKQNICIIYSSKITCIDVLRIQSQLKWSAWKT